MEGTQPPPFSVDVRQRDDAVLVAVAGELDLATAGEVETAVMDPVRDARHVVLDLRDLAFMDSSGVRVVVAAHLAAEEHGGRLSLVRLAEGSPVQRVLEISGLDTVLHQVDDA
ncbi:STAS domain-containing protein [Baekduia soli]|uniref:STAS domain-containing protein n=1 Tax=Baekduia soli TaxID=496014 RepID=UPI00165217C3|nr:STAS domain-containing protein [Baekduia soli]